jgi:serine/threonine protein phosphatase PrpC
MDKATLRYFAGSDMGRVRRNNEDAFYADPERGIFLVVDGIGGQAAGEKAAELAVGRVRARLERQIGATEQRVREAIAMANNEIFRAAQGNPEWKGMACVLTLVVLENGEAVCGHVGDSRLYQISGGEIRKITHDHSPVGEREDSGELTEGEAMQHPRRNEVFRDVGSEQHTPGDEDFIEVRRFPCDGESALVLCSDGLSDQVPSAKIREVVQRNAGDPESSVRELIEAANRAGGKDNVTVLVVEGDGFSTPPRPAEIETAIGGWLPRMGMFAAGFALAAGLAWIARSQWQPAPIVIAPRHIVVTTTIAAAMADARPGDTVDVPEGEYREQVRLKSGVTLRARVPREPILRAAPLNNGPAVIAENVTAARFSGFRILADPQIPVPVGISLRDSAVEIDDVEVKGAGIGIEIRGAASPIVRASAVRDCLAEGVLILGPSAPWLSHNLIQANHGLGIAARDGARPGLLGNVIDRNAIEPAATDSVKEQNFFLEPKPSRGGRKQ